jgi:hypothetical protein
VRGPAAVTIVGLGLAVLSNAAAPLSAEPVQTGNSPSKGLTIWLHKVPLQGDLDSIKTEGWERVSLEEMPRPLRGNPIVASDTILATFDSSTACVTIYTRKGDRLKKRGICVATPVSGGVAYKLARESTGTGAVIEVFASSSAEPANAQLAYTVRLNIDGVIEFKPTTITRLIVKDAPTRYGIVPSFIGTDLVFDPGKYAGRNELYVPSMNLYLGLTTGNDCMMVAVWPPGNQVTKLGLKATGDQRTIESFSIDMDHRRFYLTWLECPNVWHAETLKDEYLERHTPIDWKRPFDARWIGRFFIESSDYHFPFYFDCQKRQIWGRYVRDWYEYPVWFDGDKTIIHFEKKFPPTGEMLIYFLEGYGGTTRTTQAVLSPVGVMQKALGADQARKLLDFEGIANRFLQRDGLAVCAMSDEMGRIFANGNAVRKRAEVERLANDIATFIRLVRERVMEFDAFAKQTRDFLDTQMKADPDLTTGFAPVAEMLEEIPRKIKGRMPSTSLDEIRAWTDEAKGLIDKDKGGKERLVVLAHQWRSVAGTQDDLARDLAVSTIGIMEAAAEAGVISPKHVKLAEQIIARCRQVLRHGSTWEPRRVYTPARTPG